MPVYTLFNKITEETYEEVMSYKDMEKLTKSGDIVMVPQAFNMGYTLVTKHPDNAFRDILKEMKKKPGIGKRNNINVI